MMFKHILFFMLVSFFSMGFADESDALKFLRDQISHFPRNIEQDPQEMITLVNTQLKESAGQFSLERKIRLIDPKAVEKLFTLLQQSQPKVFINSAQLVGATALEWVGTMVVWEYLQKKVQACVCIQSGEDSEAHDAAIGLAEIVGTCAQPAPIWNRELSLDPDALSKEMQEELQRPLCTHTIFIAMTHSQQVGALAQLMHLSDTMVNPFGFLIVTGETTELFPEGLFVSPPGNSLEAIQPSLQPMDGMHPADEDKAP